jgi:hypothetical protein
MCVCDLFIYSLHQAGQEYSKRLEAKELAKVVAREKAEAKKKKQ